MFLSKILPIPLIFYMQTGALLVQLTISHLNGRQVIIPCRRVLLVSLVLQMPISSCFAPANLFFAYISPACSLRPPQILGDKQGGKNTSQENSHHLPSGSANVGKYSLPATLLFYPVENLFHEILYGPGDYVSDQSTNVVFLGFHNKYAGKVENSNHPAPVDFTI